MLPGLSGNGFQHLIARTQLSKRFVLYPVSNLYSGTNALWH